MDSNDAMLKNTLGFNVLNGKSIFAHYTNEKTPEAHERFKNYLLDYSLSKEEVIALPEEDTIFVDDDGIVILGNKPYYEFIDGVEIKKDIEKEKTL